MITSIRKWISRTLGVMLLVLTLGMIQINWSGTNTSKKIDGEIRSDISEPFDEE